MFKLCSKILISTLALTFAAAPCSAQTSACNDRTRLATALGAPLFASILSLEAASCDAIAIAPGSLTLRLNQTSQPVNGGVRAEVAINYGYLVGQTSFTHGKSTCRRRSRVTTQS